MASNYLSTLGKDFSLWWEIALRITIYMEKAFITRFVSLAFRKRRKLFKLLSRSIVTDRCPWVWFLAYPYCHLSLMVFHRRILSHNKVYCVIISAWGLEVARSDNNGWLSYDPRNAERVTCNSSTSFLLWKTPKHLLPISQIRSL